jgi:hypothetical protein
VTGAPSKREKVLRSLDAIGGEGTAAEISQATQEQFGPQNHVTEASVSNFLVREDTVEVDKDGPDAAIFHLNGEGDDIDEDEGDEDEGDEEGLDLPPLPGDIEQKVNPSTHTATVLRAAIDVDERGSTIATSAIRDRCADEWTEASEKLVERRASTCIKTLHDRGLLEDAGHGSWRVRSADELDENEDVDEDVFDDRGADQDDDVDENLDELVGIEAKGPVVDGDPDEDEQKDVDADGRSPAPRPIKMGSGLSERELELLEAAMENRIGSECVDRDNAKRDAWLWVRARQMLRWGPP